MSVPAKRLLCVAFVLVASFARGATAPAPCDLKSGDRVAFLGDGFIEQEQYHGWLELMLTTRFADRDIAQLRPLRTVNVPEITRRVGSAVASATEIVLRNAANQDVLIPVQSIVRRTNIGSLMPAGLIDTLVPEERLDLITFMAQLGKPDEYDAAKGAVARAWKLYMVTAQNQHLGHERVVAGDFMLTDWLPAFSLVRGALPKSAIETAFPNRFNNRGLFAATRFEAPRGGTVRLTTEGSIRGIWVNGTLVPATSEFTVQAKSGANTIVVQVEDAQLSDVALRSGDVTFVME